MFTGIIEELGTVKRLTSKGIEIAAKVVLSDIKLGDSIAVNGVCLTATAFTATSFQADISEESFRRTSLSRLSAGSLVNLERAMQSGGRFGGHIVQGHVDATGTILELSGRDGFNWLRIELPERIRKFVAEKGSITVDGISLTVAEDDANSISIAVIPHTYKNTNLATLHTGDLVNIEVDLIARYLEKQLNYIGKEDRLLKLIEENL
ncbi:MAG: riboflavin synthase [Deferribacteraceae bacterium]|jgi:riboflavin synthase|nr:riboflavin synthase [Deferribacteraceae bacterium]